MTKFKKALSLLLAVCIIFSVTACENKDNDVVDENVKAKVNDKVITQAEYDEHISVYKKMAEKQYGEGAWDREVSEGQTMGSYYESTLLDQLIMDALLVEAAEKEGITMSEEDMKIELDKFKAYLQTEDEYKKFLEGYGMSEEYLKESLRKEFLINHFIAIKIENLTPTDEELQTIFNNLKMNESVRASHILVDTEEEANNIINKLNNGESFEELAKNESKDEGSAVNGGDLDYFTYTKMVQPFSDAAFAMEIGEISKPVKSDFGYHIIKVTDKKVNNDVTLETEKGTLTEYYKSYKYEDLLKSLKDNANITK